MDLSTHTYKHDKIIEAIAEIHFSSANPWDLTFFGHFYDKVKVEFPTKAEKRGVQLQWEASPAGLRQQVRQGDLRMQFSKGDGSAMVQVAKDLLAVNVLSRYPSWKVFRPLILRNAEAYYKVASPKGITRIGLRYINKFELPADGFDLPAILNAYPHVPKEINGCPRPFFMRVEHEYATNQRLILTIGEAEPSETNAIAVLLDLDHVYLNLPDMGIDGLAGRLDTAHERVEDAFESCITEAIRGIMEHD